MAESEPAVSPASERLVARLLPDDRLHVLLRARSLRQFANAYLAQQYAGELSERLRPPCPVRSDLLLRSVLPAELGSVEQLWYLADVFGSKAIVESLDEIDRCDMVDRKLLQCVTGSRA